MLTINEGSVSCLCSEAWTSKLLSTDMDSYLPIACVGVGEFGGCVQHGITAQPNKDKEEKPESGWLWRHSTPSLVTLCVELLVFDSQKPTRSATTVTWTFGNPPGGRRQEPGGIGPCLWRWWRHHDPDRIGFEFPTPRPQSGIFVSALSGWRPCGCGFNKCVSQFNKCIRTFLSWYWNFCYFIFDYTRTN